MKRTRKVARPVGREDPGRKLYLAHTRMQQGLSRMFAQAGYTLTTEGWALLNQLWERDPLTQLVLGQKLEKDAPAISRLVDSLEGEGYVKRSMSRRDRRSREVALTAKGRAAREPLSRVVTEFLDHALGGVSASELDVFIGVLDRIIVRLDAAPAFEPSTLRPSAAPPGKPKQRQP